MKKIISLLSIVLFCFILIAPSVYAESQKKLAIKSISKKESSITIKWKKIPNITGYEIQYSTKSNFTKKSTKSVKSNSKKTSKTIKNLKPSKKYYVRMRSYTKKDNKNVYSSWTKPKSVNTLSKMPTIKSISKSKNSIAVKWKKVPSITGYEIQYSTKSSFTKNNTKSVKCNSKKTSKTIKNLKPSKKYYIRMRSYTKKDNKKIYSSWTKSKSVTTKPLVKLEKILVLPNSSKLNVGNTLQIKTVFYPLNTDYKKLKFESSNIKIATVTSTGIVKAISSGTVKIKVSVEKTNIHKTITVQCIMPVAGIKITDEKDKTVEKGNKIQLHAEVYPFNATNKTIKWKTNDSTLGTVDSNGIVTAIRPTENLCITATSNDGNYVASYNLKITANKGYLQKSDLDKLNLTSVKKLMIVAHPDDEVLWGGLNLVKDEYFVVVLTNSWSASRKKTFYEAMNHTNDTGLILSYPDAYNAHFDKNNVYRYTVDTWSTCKKGLEDDLKLIFNYKNWETIVTHNPVGEYGHFHHKLTSKEVTNVVKDNLKEGQEFFYFGNYYLQNETKPEPKMSEQDLKNKEDVINIYYPITPVVNNKHKHMHEYENWIRYDEWDAKKK